MAKRVTRPKSKKANTRSRQKITPREKVVGVRVQISLLARIDEWAARQDDRPKRPDAMRKLIERALSPGRA